MSKKLPLISSNFLTVTVRDFLLKNKLAAVMLDRLVKHLSFSLKKVINGTIDYTLGFICGYVNF